MKLSSTTQADKVDRLRREYFWKGEDAKTSSPRGACHQDGDAFTLHGHRLSSLYRDQSMRPLRLREGLGEYTHALHPSENTQITHAAKSETEALS